MSSSSGQKTKKRSKFEEANGELNITSDSSTLLHDASIVTTSNKRKGMDLSRFSSEVGEGDMEPMKKVRPGVNPWNGRMYSKRYYEILKTRETLPAWEAKK